MISEKRRLSVSFLALLCDQQSRVVAISFIAGLACPAKLATVASYSL